MTRHQALKGYLRRDLFNELKWLLCAATEWDAEQRRAANVEQPSFHIQVYAMDSALLHARSLYEFFTATKLRNGRLTWRNYGLGCRQESATYNKFMKPLRGRVMHLDCNRGGYDAVKKQVVKFAHDILDLWDGFSSKTDLAPYRILLERTRDRAVEEATKIGKQYTDRGYKAPFP